MTTIAYRDGIVAVDRASFGGGVRMADVIKVRRIRDKIVVGAGDLGSLQAFTRWVERGMPGDDQPKLGDDFEGLLWDGSAWRWYDDHLAPCIWADEFWTLGTGHAVALGALYQGATAVEAIEIACKLDPYSDLPIDFERCVRFQEVAE